MRLYIAGLATVLFLSCGTTPQKKTDTIVIGKDSSSTNEAKTEPVEEVIVKPKLPKGAVTANYLNGVKAFYGYVKHVNTQKGITTIAFEEGAAPNIVLPEIYGAKLSYKRFPEFDRDLLLVTAKLKDPNFNKYFLYVLRNGSWKRVVNGWAIHKSNKPESLKPIIVDPKNPNKMKRYYSVFDLDETSELGYTWRLLSESIAISNR